MLITLSNTLQIANSIFQQAPFKPTEDRAIIILDVGNSEVTLRRSVSHGQVHYTLFIQHVEILKMEQNVGILTTEQLATVIFNNMVDKLEAHLSELVETTVQNLDRGCVREIYFGKSMFVSIHSHDVPYMNEPLRYIEIQYNNKVYYSGEYDFSNQTVLKQNLRSMFKDQISSGERPVSIPESI